MHRRFLRTFVAGFVATSVALGLFALYLREVGELDIARAVRLERASSRSVLFASGIQDDFFSYKAELYRQARPDVTVVGSSRAMQVRGEFFKDSFASWAGAANSDGSLRAVVDAIAASPPAPKLIVVFVDVWWFNARYLSIHEQYSPTAYPRWPDAATVYGAGRVLVEHVDRLPMLLRLPADRIGLLAIMSDQGFDRFGSYHSGGAVTGEFMPEVPPFDEVRKMIADDCCRFQHADRADPTLVARFLDSVGKLKALGAHVVYALPPFAHYTNRLMAQNGGYGYMEDVKRRLRASGLPFHDYTDLTPLQPIPIPDCEFLDGFHAGAIAYARILEDMANSDPALRASLDTGYLDTFVRENAGKAEGTARYNRGRREVDFLGIGCRK